MFQCEKYRSFKSEFRMKDKERSSNKNQNSSSRKKKINPRSACNKEPLASTAVVPKVLGKQKKLIRSLKIKKKVLMS